MIDPTYAPASVPSSPRTLFGWAAALAAVLTVFNLWPGIDLAASRLFFAAIPCPVAPPEGAACGSFPAAGVPPLAELRQWLQRLPVILAAGLGLLLLSRFLLPRDRWFTPWSIAATVALSTYVVAVAFLVNAVLKEVWGRPRPLQTQPFGGESGFVAAGIPSDACASNCSFVGGEAAAAAWLFCLVPLLPTGLRSAGLAAAAALYVLTSGLRIAFGAHFLSDVIAAALLVMLVQSVLTLAGRRLSGQ